MAEDIAPTSIDPSLTVKVSPAKTPISDTANSVASALSLTNHPKSSAAAYAAVASPILISIAKHFGLDLSGQEANVTAVLMLACALIAPNV